MPSNNAFSDEFIQEFKTLTPQALRSLLAQGEFNLPENVGTESIESWGSIVDEHEPCDDPEQQGESSHQESLPKSVKGKEKCVVHVIRLAGDADVAKRTRPVR
jgi:hypothetical protein